MVKKRTTVKASANSSRAEHGEPKYPYTTKPGSLRKFLQLVPTKPKPPKVVTRTLETWGFSDSNDASMLRVLKAIGLLTEAGEPTDAYASFMKKDTGPSVLGDRIRSAYKELFEHVADPARADTEELINFFNIHSGGSDKTIQYQAQTFKALADSARFVEGTTVEVRTVASTLAAPDEPLAPSGGPRFHIDLHIHLPENKSRNDYDAIFESIANHLLSRRS